MSIFLNDTKITVTMFPDGTSQVWKIPEYTFINAKYDANLTALSRVLGLMLRK